MHPTRLKNFILDQHGKPMLRKPDPDKPLDLNAYVDVSYITEENAEHWSWARAGDANTNLDFRQRVDSRRRARYEVQNNNFLISSTPFPAALPHNGLSFLGAQHGWLSTDRNSFPPLDTPTTLGVHIPRRGVKRKVGNGEEPRFN